MAVDEARQGRASAARWSRPRCRGPRRGPPDARRGHRGGRHRQPALLPAAWLPDAPSSATRSRPRRLPADLDVDGFRCATASGCRARSHGGRRGPPDHDVARRRAARASTRSLDGAGASAASRPLCTRPRRRARRGRPTCRQECRARRRRGWSRALPSPGSPGRAGHRRWRTSPRRWTRRLRCRRSRSRPARAGRPRRCRPTSRR